MNAHSMQPTIGRSIVWGRWLIILLIASLIFLVVYAIGFGVVISDGVQEELARFQEFRRTVVSIIPFGVVMVLFFFALFGYSLYVDLVNGFGEFNYRPTSALFNILIPPINFYGIGLTFSRVINYLDYEDENPDYVKIAHRLKVRLALFYAGLAGVLISLMFTLTLPGTVEALQMPSVVLFTIVEMALIFWTLLALIFLILACMQLVGYRKQEKEVVGSVFVQS